MSFRVAQLQNMCLSLLRGPLYLKSKKEQKMLNEKSQALSIIFQDALWIFWIFLSWKFQFVQHRA